MYIWQQPDWPEFTWDEKIVSPELSRASREQGILLGQLGSMGFDHSAQAQLTALTDEAIKTSEIEGENLPIDQVRSSVARRLGVEVAGLVDSDRQVDGIVDLLIDATGNHAEPLTQCRFFAWHTLLFPTGRSGLKNIRVGAWRDDASGPMQVVSGPIGHERVHFQAPPADRVAHEIARFFQWVESPESMDLLLAAALSHLWVVTIHPFDDGNGRLARAVTDLMLARSEQSSRRFYSMSSQIRVERDDYYQILERTQKGDLDVTEWLVWFLGCFRRALGRVGEQLESVVAKSRFWERVAQESLNERQIKVLNRVLDGFEGKLTSSKWAKLTKCSQDTAGRDIKDLIAKGILVRNSGGGRSTSYSVVMD